MLATQVRRIPLILSVLVVLIITPLLCLAVLRFSGARRLGSSVILDPNGVVSSSILNPNGVASGPALNPDGLASSCGTDPNGGSCQHRAGGLLASGVSIDGNGAN